MDYSKPFLPQFTTEVGKLAYDYCVTPTNIPSMSIRMAIAGQGVIRDTPTSARLNVPYFWAKFYHDGRRAYTQKAPLGPMVWFKDPAKDPRIGRSKKNYPVKASDVRPLTPAEFKIARAQEKLVIARSVKASKPHMFFDSQDGMYGFDLKVNDSARSDTHQYVLGKLAAKGLLNKTIKVTL